MPDSNGKGNSPGNEASEIQWSRATQWISRTLSVVVVMIAPGILGSILDKKFQTSFLALLGFAFGLVAGTAGLLVLAKRFTPPARGKPLSWDDETPVEPEEEKPGNDQRKQP